MGEYRLPGILPDTLEKQRARGARIVDVRRRVAMEASGRRVEGAVWVDPETLGLSHPVLRGDVPLVFYCVHGHEVSQFATALALVAGREAVYVRGGFAALVAAGVATEAVEEPGT